MMSPAHNDENGSHDDNETAYSGPQQGEWINFINTTILASRELFPQILTQGLQGNWQSVNQGFPKVPYNENLLKDLIKVYDWHITFTNSGGTQMLDIAKASRNEATALDLFKLTRGFVEILKMRLQVFEKYTDLQKSSEDLVANKFASGMRSRLIKYLDSKSKLEKDNLLELFQRYERSQAEFSLHLKDFEEIGKCLARAEGKQFDEKFNKNPFINYNLYIKGQISGKAINVFLLDQDCLWNDFLLEIQKTQQMPTARSTERNETNVRFNPQLQFNRVYNELKETCTEVEASLALSGIERLDIALSDVKNFRSKVNNLKSDYDIFISEGEKLFLATVNSLIDKIGVQKRSIIDRREHEREERRANLNTDIKSLGTIEMEPLYGFENYVSWKRSILKLNSHRDEFKRCQALRKTLRDESDILRCQNIWSYEVLLDTLKDKYEHNEILIPALIKRLTDLPNAEDSNEVLLSNINEIMNCHTQLEMLNEAALSKFDQSLISQLVLKMTPDFVTWFDNYIFDLEEKSENALAKGEVKGDLLFNNDDNESCHSGISEAELLDPSLDQGTIMRKRFISFCKRQEKIMNRLRARSYNLGVKTKKFPRKERSVFNVEQTEWQCPLCSSKNKHKNKYGKESTSMSLCPNYIAMGIDEKKEAVKKARACFSCLRPNHLVANCKVPRVPCEKCNLRHHPSLCEANEDDQADE